MRNELTGKRLPGGETSYGALTDHRHWDGASHYWTGMAVKGMEEQDPSNYNCCPDLADYEEEDEVEPQGPQLVGLRRKLKDNGYTHREVGRALGVGLSFIRQRLYGQRPFSGSDWRAVCRLAGVSPASAREVAHEG